MIYTPRHIGTVSEHQAQQMTADLARHQAHVQADQAQQKADPLGDGTKLADWEPPASFGRILERIPTRVRGISAECLRFANGRWVYRLTVVLHGIIGP
jgi:hypothetical protein